MEICKIAFFCEYQYFGFLKSQQIFSVALEFSFVFKSLRPCHTLPDSANERVTDSKILCPFVSVRMRFLSVPHAVNAFRVR